MLPGVTEVVLPAIPDETVKVSVLMLDLVLRRGGPAAHEIAWMTEEIDELLAYAHDASVGGPHAEGTETELDGCGSRRSQPPPRRCRGGLSPSERSVLAGHGGRRRRRRRRLPVGAAALMDHRVERETEVMSGWSPVGR